MDRFLQNVSDDVCSLLFVAGLAYLVVHKVEETFPHRIRSMRAFGAIAFFVMGAIIIARLKPSTGGEFFGIAGIALIGAQAAAILSLVVVPPFEMIRDQMRSWRSAARLAAEKEAAEERKAWDEEQRELKWERERPERERREREAGERAQAQAAEQKRRDTSRSECLLYFHLHSPEFASRFSREKYDEYVSKYLRDEMPAGEVEKHATKLIALMESHLEKSGARIRPMDVAALARWFEEQKSLIESQSIPDLSKQAALALLNERYNDLMTKHLEDLRP